jgi:Zn-dependent protease
MSDHGAAFARLTARWAKGRRDGLLHLFLSPVLIYLGGYAVRWLAPDSWLIRGAPVWYYLVGIAAWFAVFIYLPSPPYRRS